MKAAHLRTLVFVTGFLLLAWGIFPRQIAPAVAAPLLLVTETPTAEPASPTPSPVATGLLETATPTNTAAPLPTDTVAPTNTSVPTATPEPPRDPRPTDAPAPLPTAIPLPTAEPTATPTPMPATPAADPAVTKSVSPGSAAVGDTVVYTIVVTNQGGSPATGVVVEDTLPAFLTLVDATATRGTVQTNGQTVRVEIGDLGVGETVEVRVTARVRTPAVAPNNSNLAVVSSTSPDANPDNNQASAPLNVIAPATLPRTGGSGPAGLPLLAAFVGLALIVSSLVLRRYPRQRSNG